MKKSGLHITILMGGNSSEREISLISGQTVKDALERKGYRVSCIDPARDNLMDIKNLSPDLVFIALHGRFGEDGTIQGFLQSIGIPYTGSGVLASALAMDKYRAKNLFVQEGIPTPKFEIVRDKNIGISFPVVVKPNCEGSSMGVSKVFKKDGLPLAINNAKKFRCDVLVEELIEGTEVTQAIIDGEIFPTIEIYTNDNLYDYDAKYTKGGSTHIIPPRLPDIWIKRSQDIALKAYDALGCEGVSRVDIMIDKQGIPFVLEVNTIPGMTPLSLVPDAAKAAGIDFETLCEKIVLISSNGCTARSGQVRLNGE